jgi:hypothetical protein
MRPGSSSVRPFVVMPCNAVSVRIVAWATRGKSSSRSSDMRRLSRPNTHANALSRPADA